MWRRFLVPTTIELPRVHTTILFGMGWQGGHVHEFLFGHDSYGRKHPQYEPDIPEVTDEAGVSLREALGGRKTFVYIYDYGDNWRHKLKIERVVATEVPIDRAVCIGGENACPPEDVGGAPGYEEFLQAMGDPSNPQHEDLKAWIGGAFDPAAFGVADVNERLSPSEHGPSRAGSVGLFQHHLGIPARMMGWLRRSQRQRNCSGLQVTVDVVYSHLCEKMCSLVVTEGPPIAAVEAGLRGLQHRLRYLAKCPLKSNLSVDSTPIAGCAD